jgi:hypothetical protein
VMRSWASTTRTSAIMFIQTLFKFEGAEILVLRARQDVVFKFRMDADRTQSLPQRPAACLVVDGKQPSGKTEDLYDSAVQKLLDSADSDS